MIVKDYHIISNNQKYDDTAVVLKVMFFRQQMGKYNSNKVFVFMSMHAWSVFPHKNCLWQLLRKWRRWLIYKREIIY